MSEFDEAVGIISSLTRKVITEEGHSAANPPLIGEPRTDVERVMAHHNVSREEAERWLNVYPVEKLLPERGTASALLKGAK